MFLLCVISFLGAFQIIECLQDITPTVLIPPSLSNWKSEDSGNWRTNPSKKSIASICKTDLPPSTLDTGYWGTSNAKRVFLKIRTEAGGKCVPSPANNTGCQFWLSYSKANTSSPQYITNYNVINATTFPKNTFINSSNVDQEKLQTSTLFIENMTNFTGIHFRFETLSYCGTITEYTLNYYECPKKSENLVNFKKTAAPDAYKKVEHVLGDCTENAVRNIVDPPIMDCWFNGTFEIHGSCVCDAGYKKVSKECSRKYFVILFITPSVDKRKHTKI